MFFCTRPFIQYLYSTLPKTFYLSSFCKNSLQKEGRTVFCYRTERCRPLSTLGEVPYLESDGFDDHAKAIEKDSALRHALLQLSGDFGRESMLSLQRFFSSRHAPVISTGSLKLDIALGIGGLPKGRIVEIYGLEASGKTTLALHVIKEAQKLGGYCAYFDVDNSLDPSLVESMGIKIENLLISPPGSAENLLSAVNTLTNSGSVDVIVVDSVAALAPQYELDGQIGCIHQDTRSQLMTKALRKIHSSLCQSEALIIFVNQVRANVKAGQVFGQTGVVTSGGNSLGFYAAVRLRIMKKELIRTGNKITGLGACVQVVKNKLAPAMRKAELHIRFGRGFCCVPEVLELACEHGIIAKEADGYFVDGVAFKSKEEVQTYLVENPLLLDKIIAILRDELFSQGII